MKILKNLIWILLILQFSGCSKIKTRISHFKHKKHIEFIESNPSNIESAHTLSVMSTTFGLEKTKGLFNQLSDSVKNSKDGFLVSRYLDLYSNPKIGDYFTDFEMQNQTGDTLRFSDFKGKVILLEFWASWCKGCVYQIPNLIETYDKYQESDFEIIAVSYDQDRERWVKTINEKKLNWVHLSELRSIGNTAGFIYGVSGIPDNFLIDKNGIIIARDLKGEKLNKEIAKLVDK